MTQLPEPNFIERNPDTITNEWIKLYEEKSGKTLQPAQIERLMIDVAAYRETVLRIDIQETAKQNLLSYANLENLEHIGEPLGVTKLLAKASITTIRFSIDETVDFDITIPKGTEIETKDGLFIFQTDEEVFLPSGSLFVDVKASCETKGATSNNYAIGSINNLLTPLSFVTDVANISISSGGVDDEVQVLSPEKIDFQIVATLYLFKDADKDSVISTIEKKLSEYKTTLSAKLGKSVVQTQIIAILNSVYGVFKVELKTPNDIEISESQWANLTNWNISIGGYANE